MKVPDVSLDVRAVAGRGGAAGPSALVDDGPLGLLVALADGLVARDPVVFGLGMVEPHHGAGIVSGSAPAHERRGRGGRAELELAPGNPDAPSASGRTRAGRGRDVRRRIPVAAHAAPPREGPAAAARAALVALPGRQFLKMKNKNEWIVMDEYAERVP